ncbi:MAG: GAF domain-containing protein [Pseudanabaenaceae cyanobacterium bins.68]|nr:GAF domain-containing protein [Pseudanabaenaceae cyanobacterium bins.68]
MGQAGSNPFDRQVVLLGRVLQSLRESDRLDDLITTVLDYLRDGFNYELVWLALYEPANHRLVGKGGITPAGEVKLLKDRFALKPGDLFDLMIMQRKPIPISDLGQENRVGEWQKLAQKYEIKGAFLFPIYFREEPFGLVLLGSKLWNVPIKSEEKARLSMVMGTLGTSLQRIQSEWQEQKSLRLEVPLLSLLEKLRSLTTLSSRLEEVIEQTHGFILPSRTSVYWFEHEHRYFWRRSTNRQKSLASRNDQSPGITVNSAPGFYSALSKDQVVAIADINTQTKGELNNRIMEQLGAVALVAAPIYFQSELLGFLCLEGTEPRLWSEEERNYVRGAAQLIALTAPLEEMEATLQRIASDQLLTSGIAKAVFADSDWEESLTIAAEQLCQRLGTERFWLSVYNKDTHSFDINFQYHPKNRRSLPRSLGELSEVDWKMMEQSLETIAIENLDNDYKFLSWRPTLTDLDMKALMVCSTNLGKKLEGILAIGHETARTWAKPEREMLKAVAQQVGLLLHQAQLQKETDERLRIYQAIQFGLVAIQQAAGLDSLHQIATQIVAQVMESPLALLVTWLPGRPGGQVAASFISDPAFQIDQPELVLPLDSDDLVQWVLQTEGILPLNAQDLTAKTREWLNPAALGQLLAIALRTSPDHQPTGMFVVADRSGRRWSDRHLQGLNMLANQLAWSRRHLVFVDSFYGQRQELEKLNWYKHRRLEDLYRSVGGNVQKLLDLDNSGDAASGMRLQQSLKQLQTAIASLPQLIRKEQWRLRANYETAPLAGMLKRSLERVESLIKQRQLWSQVHNQANVVIGGDIAKFEMIIHEILLFACGRSQVGARIDLWCRQIDEKFLELSITDFGDLDPNFLEEINQGRHLDLLAPSTLDQPPGLHLAICQKLIQEAGGDLTVYKLEDARILSRLVLPIAAS